MAYNNYYPATYQQPGYSMNYQQPLYQNYQPSYQSPLQNQNGIIWVQGEAAAKAYPVAPGTNVLLMDSEGECFYIKSTDASGMPQPLRTFEYKEIVNAQQQMLPQVSQDFNPNDYIKRSEYDELKKAFEELKSSMNEPSQTSAKQRIEGRSARNGQ